jgi:hypothetical protein
MDKLKQLHLKDMDENVLSQFPLEQLETLVICGSSVKDFPKISPRLKSLQSLHLALLSYVYGQSFTFTALQHPFLTTLEKLRLEYCETINLTGLIHLQHLSILGTPFRQVTGKNEVYPHLISFAWKAVMATTTSTRDQLVYITPADQCFRVNFPESCHDRNKTASIGRQSEVVDSSI